jgi:hypothetical protein
LCAAPARNSQPNAKRMIVAMTGSRFMEPE